MKRSKIYDLNSNPANIKEYNELSIIKTYNFFLVNIEYNDIYCRAGSSNLILKG